MNGMLSHESWSWRRLFVTIACGYFWTPTIYGAEGDAASGVNSLPFMIWVAVVAGALTALTFAQRFFKEMMRADEGTARMIEIASFVRAGAKAYLTQQFKIVFCFFIVIDLLLLYLAFGLKVQFWAVPIAFLTSGFFSGLAGWFGMKTATCASSRTAAAAQVSLNDALKIAFRSGAVMGLTVVGLGLLDIAIWFAILRWGLQLDLSLVTVTMLCACMGASAQALFARVGGGIFTKAADVGADLVGKVEQGIPEDDPRNPATIADNVGDNVGDVAGMGADLYESYCGSILATAALGVAAYSNGKLTSGSLSAEQAQIQTLMLPMAIAAVGIFLSVVGIFMVKTDDGDSSRGPHKALSRGINSATVMVALAAMGLAGLLMPRTEGTLFWGMPGAAFSIAVGLASGWLIGKWTEYSTSDEFSPTQRLAEQAETGPATIIIGGIADGMMSVWIPVAVICLGTVMAFGFASGFRFNDVAYFSLGLYGVGIAAVGMLSTLGITLATDAYGPIADNAGGNAQMAGLDPKVRERTDALDSLGNTTAATGKGFAIGSAALTALALLAAYVEEVRIGFEHWGDDVVQERLIESGPGTYKLSNGFAVNFHKHGNDIHTTYLMAMPSDVRHPEIAEAWKNIKTVRQAANASDARIDDLLVSTGHGKYAFRASRAPLLDLHTAAIPDFTRFYDATLMNPKVLVGVFLGAMSTFLFCAMTMKAVGRAAKGMVEEVRRQFREKSGIMAGTQQPDYAAPVAISTKAAQREMVIPSLLGLAMPVAVGAILGVAGVMGLLVGTLTTGFCLAIFMANSGGSWDNAKKYIEAGHHGGKGSDAHKAGVVGDTVGDPFKDTSGPSLNILIKLMSVVSVVAAGFVVRYSLVALGIF